MLSKRFTKDKIEAGVDEVGRGCLSGPVVAAAVILPDSFEHELLNDSKQLTDKQRQILSPIIKQNAVSYAIGIVDNHKIDEVNILNATYLAMHEAISKLDTTPEILLVDGNQFKAFQGIKHECFVKGDGRFMSIAAASILAKVYRDDLMKNYHKEYPFYGWHKNSGYPTKEHRDGIRKHGITPLHRKSFRLLPEQLELFAQ